LIILVRRRGMTVRNDAPNPLVHRVSLSPENETRKAKTKLDEVLEEREGRAAQRYSAATMEQMAIDAENEVARARGDPPKYKYHGGDEMTDEEKEKKKLEDGEQRDRIMASATALINSGLDPKQVGQMLLGLNPTPSGYPPVAQGMGFEEVMQMVGFIVGKRETDELKDIIASLDKKIEDLAKGGGTKHTEPAKTLTPMEYAQQQVEYMKALKELGVIKEPVPTGASGEPLEVVKERNRHNEKMEEIKGDTDYKTSLAETVAGIPERVGRGIAGQFEEEEPNHNSNGGELEYVTCPEKGCGAKIHFTPEAVKIVCPKCGAVYKRRKAGESGDEEVANEPVESKAE
jgi:predicted RNA-binding Zn-ribbon protein involved in translation (DUF1610 family)